MKLRPSWEADGFSAIPEISRILWNSPDHYPIRKCLYLSLSSAGLVQPMVSHPISLRYFLTSSFLSHSRLRDLNLTNMSLACEICPWPSGTKLQEVDRYQNLISFNVLYHRQKTTGLKYKMRFYNHNSTNKN